MVSTVQIEIRNRKIMPHKEITQLIKKLDLQPHPEGGYYRETYRSKGLLKDGQGQFDGPRNYGTSIYFLLTSDTFSAFHRIKQDETWHFYKGTPIEIYMINENGEYSKVLLGNDILNGEKPQFTVAGGTWFAAKVIMPESFALVGCSVYPGFDFQDFELPSREKLVELFPDLNEIITSLTR